MNMTMKQRMLAAIRGEMPDVLPYAPRLDLWYVSRSIQGTLPEPYGRSTMDEICRAEGWGQYKLSPDYQDMEPSPEGMALAALGLYPLRVNAFEFRFATDIQLEARQEGDVTRATFHTPLGSVSAVLEMTEQLRKDGITIPWVTEPLIKQYEDWKIVARIFDSLELVASHQGYLDIVATTGENGLLATPVDASSPMHHIQKYLFDATDFYIYYRERSKDLAAFADSVANYFNQALRILAAAPVEVVTWGGNYDATITFPPFFEREILPWLERAAETFKPQGKLLITHCDGENQGLMDLIKHSGVDAAESVCPFPMTHLKLHEYYAHWSDRITTIGGIPAELLIREQTSDEEFAGYLDYLFKAVVPGNRFIAGIADATPATADFDRLRRLHDLIAKKGRLPLSAGALPPYFAKTQTQPPPTSDTEAEVAAPTAFKAVRQAIFSGDAAGIRDCIGAVLDRGIPAGDILQQGMIATMQEVGDKFSAGEVYIPEMLLAARAMEQGVSFLKPSLLKDTGGERSEGTIVIGSVFGDMHDIGKNLVAMMLRGVGYDVVDLGTNVATAEFVRQTSHHRPQIVALSALLTTTMPAMEQVIAALCEAGLQPAVKVMVGGAPVTQKFADQIGADGYALNAGEAVRQAKLLASAATAKRGRATLIT